MTDTNRITCNGGFVATTRQKAARAKTISRLPKKTRTALGKQGAKMARRKRRAAP